MATFRDGFKSGRWGDRQNRKALEPLRDTAVTAWREAA